ncbi:hypothetical protein X734_32880 [Mesorhizobium sp. L2C084A000]|nr:hypothetical protein X734_32880 [Mesorhizobium sp. L2C084A000]
MSIPAVGPAVALAYTATIDVPARFRNSKAIGPIFDLTPVLNESGESRRIGRISRRPHDANAALRGRADPADAGDEMVLAKTWATNVAKRRGKQKAVVALARRSVVIMHRIWRDGTQFRWTRTEIMPVAG